MIKKKNIMLVAVIFIFAFKWPLYGDSLTGTVKDNVSRGYIQGAVILLENTSFADTTDAEGKFRISEIPKGEYTVVILSENYQQRVYKNFLIDDSSFVSINHPENQPAQFELMQNYPNPFNPTTQIRYKLSKAEHVRLTIYDNIGRKIKALVNHWQTSGVYSISWNAKNDRGEVQSSGVYFYQLQMGKKLLTKRMVLIK